MSTAVLTLPRARRVRLWPVLAALIIAAAAAWSFIAGMTVCEAAFHVPAEARRPASMESARAVAHEFGGSVRDVEIRAGDSVPLRGWFFQPAHANGAAVMLFHGMADSRASSLPYARLLLRHGFSVLAADQRSNGASGGAIATFGALERYDTPRWGDWLLAQTGIRRLYGLGESMGAGILLESLDTEHRFRAVVAESSFANFRDIVYDRLSQHFGTRPALDRLLYAGVVEGAWLYAREQYGIDLDGISPEEAVARTHTPVFLIHGQADENVYPYHAHRIAAHNPAYVSLWEPPRTCHTCAVGSVPDEFERRVIEWFQSHT